MSYGPPPEPNVHPAPPQPYPPQPYPPQPYPHQPWTDPHGRGWPGGPPPVEPAKGFAVAAAALVFGLVGCVVPLLPINLDGIRQYTSFPFALPGLALAIVGCTGRRRGKPMAVVGGVLAAIALFIGLLMVVIRN
ncbi:hypothetical protein [Kribbella sp. NPDC006257]|uniref:hypothetical protein n=1 Tax=Kribbella sp. NPDC006257 TaxID=3156738 RepID=UPI0033A03A77